jgi:hypothetical protein
VSRAGIAIHIPHPISHPHPSPHLSSSPSPLTPHPPPSSPDRIDLMRAMILAPTVEQRRDILKNMLPLQRADFLAIFRQCGGKQVRVRVRVSVRDTA